MKKPTVAESRARSVAESHRQVLAQRYRSLAAYVRAELPHYPECDPPAPNMTRIIAGLERQAGHPAPVGTLSAWEVLQLAERRQR